MTDFVEKHYSIDAGIGEKMDGCPYSLFDDGHDVKDFIIPPDGYEFVGFVYEPLPNDQIYDGKLVAQFRKLPFSDRASKHIRPIVITAGVIAIITLIILLTISIFKKPKPTKTSYPKNEVNLPIDTLSDADISEAEENDTTAFDQNDIALTEPLKQPQASITEPSEQVQTAANKTDSGFTQEFWDLIHQNEGLMDTYTNLYQRYQGKVSGEEYDYLRLTILKNYKGFKNWHKKMTKIPKDELESIETIEMLKKKIKEIN